LCGDHNLRYMVVSPSCTRSAMNGHACQKLLDIGMGRHVLERILAQAKRAIEGSPLLARKRSKRLSAISRSK
jgi:hypothetical protein